jgi:hypothetical protein
MSNRCSPVAVVVCLVASVAAACNGVSPTQPAAPSSLAVDANASAALTHDVASDAGCSSD